MSDEQGNTPSATPAQGAAIRPSSILTRDTSQGLFPFEAFEFDPESTATPIITLKSPWKLAAAAWVSGTASALASQNAVVPLGAIAFETDTLSFKIGDGSTAYASLTYFYRGLPVAGEPSLGTPHPHSALVLNNYDPASTPTWLDVDLSAYVPVGTKMAWIYTIAQTPTVGRQSFVDSTAHDEYGRGYCYAANIQVAIHTLVLLDSNRKFTLYWDNADWYAAYCWLKFHWE